MVLNKNTAGMNKKMMVWNKSIAGGNENPTRRNEKSMVLNKKLLVRNKIQFRFSECYPGMNEILPRLYLITCLFFKNESAPDEKIRVIC